MRILTANLYFKFKIYNATYISAMHTLYEHSMRSIVTRPCTTCTKHYCRLYVCAQAQRVERGRWRSALAHAGLLDGESESCRQHCPLSHLFRSFGL